MPNPDTHIVLFAVPDGLAGLRSRSPRYCLTKQRVIV